MVNLYETVRYSLTHMPLCVCVCGLVWVCNLLFL